MAQRRRHYERAFETYLRGARIPYVAVDEAKRALLPEGARLKLADGEPGGRTLKSFDFVVYGDNTNLLVEIKGRRAPKRKNPSRVGGRLECWVTLDDIASLRAWEKLFGDGFEGAFVFVYQCEDQPPDGLFDEVIEDAGRWYAVRAIALDDYEASMKTRSPRWRTVDLPTEAFERHARPFAPPPSSPRHTPGDAPPGPPTLARIA
ncbi:MAG: HYExAFE family protein [Phycisphaerales bacterium]